MKTCRAGFAMVELLLAMALTAIIATAALAALNVVVEADARAIQRSGLATDVARALALLQRDVRYATAIDVQTGQWTFSQGNGTSVVYALAAGGTELHRYATSNLAATLLVVQALLLAVGTSPQYSARGHLRDDTYEPTAVIQGATNVRIATFRAARINRPIGVQVAVDHAGPDGVTTTTSCVATSLPLAERNSKP
jgi:prepilin-type N-terminal cleavage/methylation domain-containing protein